MGIFISTIQYDQIKYLPIQFRYRVNSAVKRTDNEQISEIRRGFTQYYDDIRRELNRRNTNIHFERGNECLWELIDGMKIRSAYQIVTAVTEAEEREFDPIGELPNGWTNRYTNKYKI